MFAGAHTVTANYLGFTLGNYTFTASTDTDPHTINQAATSTAVTGTPNPSNLGQLVTFTATVTPTNVGPFVPGGTVTFIVDGTPQAPVAMVGNTATFATSLLTVGAHTIDAQYNGNSNFLASLGSTIQNVNPVTTTTTLVSTPNPSAFGAAVTFTATVTPSTAGPSTATGTVTFTVDGVAQATVALSGGTASFTTSGLASGPHVVIATYSGDASFLGSAGALTQVVQQGPPPPPPPPASQLLYAVGADAGGGPQVIVYDSNTRQIRFSFFAFAPNFTGGVRVAMADVTGDGVQDIICGAGPGGGPQIAIFDGTTGLPIAGPLGSFFGITPSSFTGGVFVAGGDVNGDGFADVMVSADSGGGPQVTVFDGRSGALMFAFNAMPAGFTGGVRVASADVDGDGFDDLITGAGPGALPQVTIYSGNTLSVLQSFWAFPLSFRAGVYVAAGDLDGDGKAEAIVGAGRGGLTQVTIFSTTMQTAFLANSGATIINGQNASAGTRVGATLINGRGAILTGAGPGAVPQTSVYDGPSLQLLDTFFSFPTNYLGGEFIAG